MFGNGLYFTDVVSKAALRCGARKGKTEGYLMIFEVATGEEYKISRSKLFSKPPSGFHSVKGVGKMGPLNTVEYKGAVGYAGTPMKNDEEISELKMRKSHFAYNEYVVFDDCQVKPAFLVKVSFKFN